MTEQEYYAKIRAFGLKPSQFPGIFFTVNGEPVCVPLASEQTPEQRTVTIGKIRTMLGIGLSD